MLPGTKMLSNLPGQFQMGISHVIFLPLHSTVLGEISKQLTTKSESNQERTEMPFTVLELQNSWHSPQ